MTSRFGHWMQRPLVLTAIAVCAAGPAPATAQDQAKQAAAPKSAEVLPASLSGIDDEGVFLLFKNEECLATIEFRWQADGTLESKSTITMAGQTIKQSISIPAGKEGRWERMSLQTPLDPVQVTRDGQTIRVETADKVETLKLKPGTMLFENFTPTLMSQAVLNYDQKKGGKQTFPMFIVPKIILDGSLELKDTVQRRVGNRDFRFTRYVYGVPGVDLTIWVDDDSKLYLADVPAQRAAYVRQGFESLRRTPDVDPLLSKPQHDVKCEHDVPVPMRDGKKLATDIYRPKADGKFPVILVRTPYQKLMSELQAKFYTRRGYVCAIQDCRGRFGSPGTWEPFVNEPKDGYDAIEWLASQPWSSGKVGMIGASYLGWVQWWAAGENPPHLVTIIPNVSPPDPFYNIPYEYGVFFLLGSIWWADVLESEATADLSGAAMHSIGKKKYRTLLRDLPVIDLDKAVLGKENPYWRKWIEHPNNDEYWEQASFLDKLKDVRIPVFHQSGWFDGDGIGSKLNYLRMTSHGHPHQKLVLGPWGHTAEAQRRIGDRDFGPAAIIDLPRDYLRWFDYWLKGIDIGIVDQPLVSVFVMGSNKWLYGNTYPLEETRLEKLYLTGGGHANTSKGDGGLTFSKPPADSPVDRYTYDPGDPTPSPQFYEEPADEGDTEKETSVEAKKQAQKEFHEKVASTRRDMLVYTTEPLEKPLTFAGPLSAVLYAASSARDTDWFVRLVEVGDDDEILLLAEGKIRARFRNSMKKPELLEPGEVYAYDIDLWQTGITIPSGRRLRVEVASASFPLFSRNLNTGGHNEKDTEFVSAKQTIYHNAEYPSHILLPVIPDSTPPTPPKTTAAEAPDPANGS